MQRRITDDLHALMAVIPPHIGEALAAADRTDELLEVILDLGRVPTARYVDTELVLSPDEISRADIDYLVTRIGDFDADNRAGMERTLHRISCIRNRRGQIVGLTCRVGRAVYGTIDIIQDIIESGKSILMLGRPGVGKCVTGDTLLLTENGLQPIADFVPDALDDDQFAPLALNVYGRNGLEPCSYIYNGGYTETLKVTTRQGFSIQGTPEHPLLVLSATGELEFRPLADLKLGDHLVIQRNQKHFGSTTHLPAFDFIARTNALNTPVPDHLTPELARFLGYVIAEGTLSRDNQVYFSHTDPEIQEEMVHLTSTLFGLNLRRHLSGGQWNGKDFRVFGVKLRRYLEGLGLIQGLAASKRIPSCILTAPKPMVTAFLQALFEGDGSVYGPVGRVEFASASRELVSQLHVLLLNYGIVGNFRAKRDRKYERDYFYLTLLGENVVTFEQEIGFVSTRKRSKLAHYADALRAQPRNPNLDVVPYQTERLRALRVQVGVVSDRFARFTKSDRRSPSYHTLGEILSEAQAATATPEYQTLDALHRARFFFDAVVKLETSEDYVYDLTVPGTHSFFANGFVSHNTTMLREAARILAENKRVVIVDTSNEIGGDGDVPHPAVGRARRMQVREPNLQHEVMIEGVENHNPEVIVIDEIGRELEAQAARTIAERGVQLIGTAHGNTLENLMLNPTLADLIGGIESVTLSDEEARRRGTQKTVLERRAPPTFDVLIEIQDRERLAVHHDVAVAVDTFLRGRARAPELRYRDANGEVKMEAAPEWSPPGKQRGPRDSAIRPPREAQIRTVGERAEGEAEPPRGNGSLEAIRIYAYGIARNRLEQSARRLRVPALLVDDVDKAQALVTLKTYYRQHQRPIADAEERGLPIYVLRANTSGQIENFLSDLFNLRVESAPGENLEEAMTETQQAIDAVMRGEPSADLTPASAYVRRMQHELARKHNLISHSYGKEPRRWVRIFRD
jgi:stage III sporulation protein SpoIIIAA